MGEVIAYDKATGLADIDVKNKFGIGDSLEMISDTGNETFNVTSMVKAKDGSVMEMAPGSGHIVRIPLPKEPTKFALIAKNISPETEPAS